MPKAVAEPAEHWRIVAGSHHAEPGEKADDVSDQWKAVEGAGLEGAGTFFGHLLR